MIDITNFSRLPQRIPMYLSAHGVIKNERNIKGLHPRRRLPLTVLTYRSAPLTEIFHSDTV